MTLFAIGAALAGLAWLAYRRGLNAINPASADNVIYTGINAAGTALTDDTNWNAGAAIYDMLTPRGIRNNNPGNIVHATANNWRGMTGTDGRFVVFSDPVYGIRAMARILLRDLSAGKNTVQALISEWAPASENNTAAYVRSVASALGVTAAQPLSTGHMPALIAAIIKHENGQQPYSAELIGRGILMAGV